MAKSYFTHLPEDGWKRTTPLTFMPEYDDSTTTYDLIVAVRHTNSYRFRNLVFAIDVIGNDTISVRHDLDLKLADEYGNWSGGGFGSLYQLRTVVARDISPADARSVVVWQAMDGIDTLRGLEDLGIIVAPK